MGRHARTATGIALSVLLLWWALRDVSPAEVMHELGSADPLLFTLAVLATMGGFWFRALRWGVLLTPTYPGIAFHPRFAATVIGFAANNLLPARVGEFARAYALTRLAGVRIGASFATLVVERLLDGLVLVGLLFVSMGTVGFPLAPEVGGFDPRTAARVAALAMGLFGAALFAMVLAPSRAVALAEAIVGRILPSRVRVATLGAFRSFLEGLLVLRNGRLFAVSAGLALAQWLFTAVSFLLAFRAFGIDDVPFAGAVFLQSVVSLAVAIPSSPGFFGPFEAAARVGLSLWAVGSTKAVSFAVGFHIGGFIPVTLLGIYYVWRYGLSWGEVRHSEDATAAGPAGGGGAPPTPTGRAVDR